METTIWICTFIIVISIFLGVYMVNHVISLLFNFLDRIEKLLNEIRQNTHR
jgi:hypothetical protein